MSKHRAPLVLIELSVMLLVLALASALCLQAFQWADRRSDLHARRDQGDILIQNAAEAVKAAGGDMERSAKILNAQASDEGFSLDYGDGYSLQAVLKPDDDPFVGFAELSVYYDGQLLTGLTVCWQEEVS